MRGKILLLTSALLALLPPGPIPASALRTCPDGRYVVAGDPIFQAQPPASGPDAIVIEGGTVRIESGCEATRASMSRARDGAWRVRASWRECGGAMRVRLRAVIAPGCEEMTGVVETRRPRSARRFVALNCADPSRCGARCLDDAGCSSGEFCATPPGRCGGEGRCLPLGGACPALWAPVCGCDGATYDNACEAAAAGASVARLGTCDGSCDVTRPCGPGEFCELPPGVCASGLDPGRCVESPTACQNDVCGECDVPPCPLCPSIFEPECGCDGVTYATSCERRRAGVSKSYDGVCGCAPLKCAPGTEPSDQDGDGCPDACAGRCRTACDCVLNPAIRLNDDCPLLCATCGDYWTCDDGTCVEVCGPKPPDPCKACGGIAGLPCGPEEICDLPPGECSSADLFGVCRTRPEACIFVFDPVCGCDGVTYGNDCERLAAGAQKDHDGRCKR